MAVAVPATHFDTVRATYAQIGVRQIGDEVLRRRCKALELPADARLASEILDCLTRTIASARRLHNFTRGIGLAAPQIGFARRIAVIQLADGLPLRLINPRIVGRSRETEVALEGCLSFFDLRGEVRRPRSATIAFADPSGATHEVRLEGDAARLALHELDHLNGRLYIDRMDPNARLIEDDGRHP